MKDKKQRDLLMENLKKTPIVQIACERSGISRCTYYRWRKDAKFSKDADTALREGILFINDIAESQLLSLVKDKNLGAINQWLRHHHPAYAEKIQLTGKVETNTKLTPEQKVLIKKAFALAAFNNQSYAQEKKDNN
ncbi:MAG: hypothetical protein ABFD00_08090 [Chloroherpetonaceae bacterium]